MFNNRSALIKKYIGFSLIELMLALIISTLVFSVLLTVYISAKKNFIFQTSLNTIQENARLSIEILTTEIRKAGYIGCGKLTADFPLKNTTAYLINDKNKIMIRPHDLTVRHASTQHANVIHQTLSAVSVTRNPDFSVNDILIISNCMMAEIFIVKEIIIFKDQQKIISTQPLTMLFSENSEVSKLEINTYYVDKTNRVMRNGDSVYALYIRDIYGRKTELIEGISAVNIQMEKNGVDMKISVSSLSGLIKTWSSYVSLRNSI